MICIKYLSFVDFIYIPIDAVVIMGEQEDDDEYDDDEDILQFLKNLGSLNVFYVTTAGMNVTVISIRELVSMISCGT